MVLTHQNQIKDVLVCEHTEDYCPHGEREKEMDEHSKDSVSQGTINLQNGRHWPSIHLLLLSFAK